MIERYRRAEMTQVWSEQSKFNTWLEVELAACEELVPLKVLSKNQFLKLKKECLQVIQRKALDPERITEIEKTTRHDVIAFTTAVVEQVGPLGRYIHFGLTSSDVVDTALSIQLGRAGKILIEDLDLLLATLKKLALKHKGLATIGRSHGMSAEPTSYGMKFAGWYTEMSRNRIRLARAVEELRYGKMSGAVGVNAHFSPLIEKRILKRLGLKRELISTQVLPRDRLAEFLSALAILGGGMERIAVELRHLQRSEVGEVLEGFQKGQKGSSAMPHKRNPISSENLTGCARLLRSYLQAGLENIALWHERDISHSSVERVILPDATQLCDYALSRLTKVLSELTLVDANIKRNLESVGTLPYSGHFLLELVKKGVTREQAYSWIQSCALEAIETRQDFVELAEKHPEISKYLSRKETRGLGSLKHQLRYVDEMIREAVK